MKFEIKLREVAQMLDCSPAITAIGEALSGLVLWSYDDDDVQNPLERYQCRLCNFGTGGQKEFLEHLVENTVEVPMPAVCSSSIVRRSLDY